MLQFGMSRYVMRVKEELLCSSSFILITTGRIETYQIATYSIRTLLKMDYWSPKHVELLNVMNKINHQILCILLDYKYIQDINFTNANCFKYFVSCPLGSPVCHSNSVSKHPYNEHYSATLQVTFHDNLFVLTVVFFVAGDIFKFKTTNLYILC